MQYDNMTTAGNLKEVRKALGMKRQADLAQALGIHKITVAKMEAGMLAMDKRTALAVECLLRRAGITPPA